MDNQQLFELADKLKAKKLEKEELEAKVKEINAEIDILDEKLTSGMTEAEVDKFSRNGSLFYLKSRLFASPVASKKQEFLQALKDNDCKNLITEQVNANTLASFIKEYREENGVDRPKFLGEDLLNIYEKVSVGIKKS